MTFSSHILGVSVHDKLFGVITHIVLYNLKKNIFLGPVTKYNTNKKKLIKKLVKK